MSYNEGRHLALVQKVGSHSVGREKSEWMERRCSRWPADVALPGHHVQTSRVTVSCPTPSRKPSGALTLRDMNVYDANSKMCMDLRDIFCPNRKHHGGLVHVTPMAESIPCWTRSSPRSNNVKTHHGNSHRPTTVEHHVYIFSIPPL